MCRVHREVEWVSGRRAGACSSGWAYALTSLTPAQADARRGCSRFGVGSGRLKTGSTHVRDMTCGEDASQIRSGQGPAIFAGLRKTALGLMRHAKQTNIAAELRYAMYPAEALARLRIIPPCS